MDMDEARTLEGQTHRHTRGHNSMTRKTMKIEEENYSIMTDCLLN